MNADGRFSLADLGPMVVHLFFLPGDCMLWLVFTFAPGTARFFELTHSAFGGVESAVLSTAGWLFAILVVGTCYSLLVRLNWAVTAYLSSAYREFLRRSRVGKILLAYRLRDWTQPRQEPGVSASVPEVELDETDLEVLSLHSDLDSEMALGVREIAASLGVSVGQAQGTIDKLKRLELLINRMDEHSSYQLTRPGQMFLSSRNMLPT